MMNKTEQLTSSRKGILILVCLCIVAAAAATINHHRQTKLKVQFLAKFDSITREHTTKMVRESLGPPTSVDKSNWEIQKVMTESPSEVWHYNVGHASYMIVFSPPGLDHWKDTSKWQVQIKVIPK